MSEPGQVRADESRGGSVHALSVVSAGIGFGGFSCIVFRREGRFVARNAAEFGEETQFLGCFSLAETVRAGY